MKKQSIFYKNPFLYKLGLRLIHRNNFDKRYRYMASFVQKGDLVLEPACGPAILADFLPEGAYYQGFDTNRAFVNYAFRKHSGVFLGNVLDPKNYSQADVIIACDVLHHLQPRDRRVFLSHCFDSAKKKLVICEPARSNDLKERIFYPISKLWFEYIEQDGTNQPKLEGFWSKKGLESQMKEGFGIIPDSIPKKIKQLGVDFIVIYFKKE